MGTAEWEYRMGSYYTLTFHFKATELITYKQQKQLPWPESASELYRPTDCRLSAKLVPAFADRAVWRGQRS
jgi:hypothetical protein